MNIGVLALVARRIQHRWKREPVLRKVAQFRGPATTIVIPNTHAESGRVRDLAMCIHYHGRNWDVPCCMLWMAA